MTRIPRWAEGPPSSRSGVQRFLWIALVVSLLGACGGGADGGGATADEQTARLEEIDQLEGAEREDALLECASEEEPLLWYTTLIEDQLARPLAEAFQERYPGLTVQISRSNSGEVIEKMLNESRAGRIESDVWSASEVTPLKEAGVIEEYGFPTAADYPEDLMDPDGTWAASNVYVYALAYNTQQVPPEEAPQTYEDLLDARWQGQMAWSTSSTSGWTGFVGHILTTMDEEEGMAYLEQLGQQNVVPLDVSARQVVDQVIAGEYAIALQIFNNHPVISAATGAPIDWVPLEPLMVNPAPTGITAGASSPCAARLFIDYELSEEGQKVFQAADYLPASPEVPANDQSLIPADAGLEYEVMLPEFFDEHREEWNAVVDSVFR